MKTLLSHIQRTQYRLKTAHFLICSLGMSFQKILFVPDVIYIYLNLKPNYCLTYHFQSRVSLGGFTKWNCCFKIIYIFRTTSASSGVQRMTKECFLFFWKNNFSVIVKWHVFISSSLQPVAPLMKCNTVFNSWPLQLCQILS